MKRAIIVGLAALATQAWASDKGKEDSVVGLDTKEATIPFLDQHDAVRTWQANGDAGVWLQDGHKQWYYAKTFAPCQGLPFAVRLGFKNRTLNQLSRDSEIIVPNEQNCPLISLRKSAPPPGKERDQAAKAKAAE